MSSTASPLPWRQAVVARPVLTPGAPATTGGRHLAPEVPDASSSSPSSRSPPASAPARPGARRAGVEPRAARPRRDEVDAFDWLGFRPALRTVRRPRTSASTGTSAANAWPRWLRASFSSGRQLGGGDLEPVGHEHRVVAEAVGAPLLADHACRATAAPARARCRPASRARPRRRTPRPAARRARRRSARAAARCSRRRPRAGPTSAPTARRACR